MRHSLLEAETWFAFVAHLNVVVVALVQGEMIVLTERINVIDRSVLQIQPAPSSGQKSRKPIASSSPLFCYWLAAFVAYSSLVEMLAEKRSQTVVGRAALFAPQYRPILICWRSSPRLPKPVLTASTKSSRYPAILSVYIAWDIDILTSETMVFKHRDITEYGSPPWFGVIQPDPLNSTILARHPF
ncbi:hypothetical protein C8R42DRAFT_718046 [Lentinula raphanica]|nr:hypothetical protein C8R42DRAFT_718046 [Lentinula raphanica]